MLHEKKNSSSTPHVFRNKEILATNVKKEEREFHVLQRSTDRFRVEVRYGTGCLVIAEPKEEMRQKPKIRRLLTA